MLRLINSSRAMGRVYEVCGAPCVTNGVPLKMPTAKQADLVELSFHLSLKLCSVTWVNTLYLPCVIFALTDTVWTSRTFVGRKDSKNLRFNPKTSEISVGGWGLRSNGIHCFVVLLTNHPTLNYLGFLESLRHPG
jgi:hypothetical protein